jgi:hypothetical protein
VSVLQQSVLSSEVSGLQLLVLHLDVFVQEMPVSCQARGVWPTEACTAPELSVYQSLCCPWSWTSLSTRAFVLHMTCLSTRAGAAPGRVCLLEPVLHLCVSVYKSFVVHLYMSAYKSLAHTVAENVRLQFCLDLFWLFKTGMFASVISIHVRNTVTNQNKLKTLGFGFVKQTEKQPKQIEFRFFSVQTENLFFYFGDTLADYPSIFLQRKVL